MVYRLFQAVHQFILEYMIVDSRHRKIDEKKRTQVEHSFKQLLNKYMIQIIKIGFNVTYKKKKINLLAETYHGKGDKKSIAASIKTWDDFAGKFTDYHSGHSFCCLTAKWILDEEKYEEI